MIATSANQPDRGRAYLDLGRAAESANHTDAAISAYRKAAEQPKNEAALLRLGMMLARKGQSADALANLSKAEELFRLSANFEGVTQTMLARARVLELTQGLASAEAQLREALKTAALTGNVEHQVRTRLELGRVRQRAGRPDEALSLAQEALDLGQLNGVEGLAITALNGLGDASAGQGDWTQAESYYQRALQLASRGRALSAEARARLMLGQALLARNDNPQALVHLKAATDFYRQGRYEEQLNAALSFYSEAYTNQGDYARRLRPLEISGLGLKGPGSFSCSPPQWRARFCRSAMWAILQVPKRRRPGKQSCNESLAGRPARPTVWQIKPTLYGAWVATQRLPGVCRRHGRFWADWEKARRAH